MAEPMDFPGCIACGKPFPPGARTDRRYCSRKCNNRHYKQIQRGKSEPVPRRDAVALLAAMTPEQRGWVAGIIEGEGTISCHVTPRIGNDYVYAQVNVHMTDEDVVRRLREWTGIGRFSGPFQPPSRAQHKPTWNWNVTSWAETDALIDAIWPLLGERRRQQARVVRGRMATRVLKRQSVTER